MGFDRARPHAPCLDRDNQQGRRGSDHLAGPRAKSSPPNTWSRSAIRPRNSRAVVDAEVSRWAPIIKASDIKIN